MNRIVCIMLSSVLLASCSLLGTRDGEVVVELQPESIHLSDDLSFTVTISNATGQPIWYHGCGQVRERFVDGAWRPNGSIFCYMETEGIRINPGTSLTQDARLHVQKAGMYRLVAHLTGTDGEELPRKVRITNAVTVAQAQAAP